MHYKEIPLLVILEYLQSFFFFLIYRQIVDRGENKAEVFEAISGSEAVRSQATAKLNGHKDQ